MYAKFYAHGKLLITGEYFVLAGAKAFALPLKLGQSLQVAEVEGDSRIIKWQTTVQGSNWFSAEFKLDDFSIINTNRIKSAEYIQLLLIYINQKSLVFRNLKRQLILAANVDFPMDWGLGSSSTLISNLANWAGIDPYSMLFAVSKGSGYDIACATAKGPILYSNLVKPTVEKACFNPSFGENLYFVYLGRKQDTAISISLLGSQILERKDEAKRITELAKLVVNSKNLDEFNGYLNEHEEIVSRAIGLPTVKSELFNDFTGTVKSLGAWGGDFVLATHRGTVDDVVNYFKQKGYSVILKYNDIVL